MFICYLIQNQNQHKTYIGATINFPRRIRQHNGELTGGAKYTKGDSWKPVLLVSGFTTWNETLRFEFIWKHIKVKTSQSRGLIRRFEMLEFLLNKDEWNHLKIWTHADIAVNLQCQQEILSIDDISFTSNIS
jgi:predicted GIY-YIG superfamily endonuclease